MRAPAGDMAVMPPLFRDKPDEWTLLKGAQHEASYPFQLDGEPFVPSATATLHATQKGEFALFLYNANPAVIASKAEQLGMRPNPHLGFIDQRPGKIIVGKPSRAEAAINVPGYTP